MLFLDNRSLLSDVETMLIFKFTRQLQSILDYLKQLFSSDLR